MSWWVWLILAAVGMSLAVLGFIAGGVLATHSRVYDIAENDEKYLELVDKVRRNRGRWVSDDSMLDRFV